MSEAKNVSKLYNDQFTEIISKLYKDSNGSQVIMNCLLTIVFDKNNPQTFLKTIDKLKFNENENRKMLVEISRFSQIM